MNTSDLKKYLQQPLNTKHLYLIKWIPDGDTREKKLRIAETIAPKWRDIAKLTGLNYSQIVNIENPGSGKTPKQCLDEVLKGWQEDPKRYKDYPYTWNGLLDLLKDAEYSILASDLREALSSQTLDMSDSGGNFSGEFKLTENSPENETSVNYCLVFIVAILAFIILAVIAWISLKEQVKYSETLPSIAENFVGRENEMTELVGVVSFASTNNKRIINLIGSPGFGKSALAIRLGHWLITEESVYVHYVNMADFPTDTDITFVLAEKILRSTARTISFDKLLDWVANRYDNTVVILDNCDDVMAMQNDKLKNAILEMVQLSSRIKVIMTSRNLELQSEYFYWFKVVEINHEAAMAFLDTTLYSLNISLEEKNAIVSLTGRVPLALRTVTSLLLQPDPPTPAAIIEDLESNPLVLLSPQNLPPQDRVNVLFNVSYSYLDENLKQVAFFLALFPGSFDKRSASGVFEVYAGIQDKDVIERRMSLNQEVLRALVARSFLEYDKRTQRYHYHQLIKTFLISKWKEMLYATENFAQSFSQYFLKELDHHASHFNSRYIKSIQFLNSERHNIQELLLLLKSPKHLQRSILLMAIDSITFAIDINYLTCRFSQQELQDYLLESYAYLYYNMLEFQLRNGFKQTTDIRGRNRTLNEYYQSIFIKLAITFSELIQEENLTLKFLEYSELIVELLSKEAMTIPTCIPTIYCQFPPNDNLDQRLTATAQLRKFYMRLASHYLALKNHSKVIQYNLKILTEAHNCENEECTYKDIAYIYLNVGDYQSASQNFELSLQFECNNPISKADILLKLSICYSKLSDDSSFNVSQLIEVCHEIMEMAQLMGDQILIEHLKTIIKSITVVNQAGRNVTFLEEKMFTIVSNLSFELQLQPQQALELLELVGHDKNDTKTAMWGSLLLKPFQQYNNFTIKDQINILQIRTIVSRAQLYSKTLEALHEMEEIFNVILNNEDIQRAVSVESINATVCFYLIPYGRYLNSCYHISVWPLFKLFFRIYTVAFPTRLAYLIFVVPFDAKTEAQGMKHTAYSKAEWQPKSKALTVGESTMYQLFCDIAIKTIDAEMSSLTQFVGYDTIAPYLWEIARFVVNVFTVIFRLWIFFSLVFTYVGIILLFICSTLVYTVEAIFVSSIHNSECSLIQVYCIIVIRELVFQFVCFLVKLLRFFNIWGFLWLEVLTSSVPWTRENLFQTYFAKCKDSYYHTIYGFWIISIINSCIEYPFLSFLFFSVLLVTSPLILVENVTYIICAFYCGVFVSHVAFYFAAYNYS